MNFKRRLLNMLGSLKIQLLLPILAVTVIIVFVLTTLVTRAYTKTIFEQEDTKIQSAFAITGNSITAILQNAQETVSSMMLNRKIEQYLANEFHTELDRVIARKDVLNEMNAALLQQPYLYGMLVLREDGTAFGNLPQRKYFMDSTQDDLLSDRILADIRSGGRWIGPYSSDEHQMALSPKPEKIILGVSARHSNTYGDYYGISVLEAKTLENYIALLADGRSSLYLVTANGDEMARAGTEMPLSAETWSAIDKELEQHGLHYTKESTGEHVYICYQKIDALNWYLVRELPVQFYDQTVRELRIYAWYVSGAVFVGALILLLWWLRSFAGTFRELSSAIVRLRHGQLEARMEKQFRITEFESIRCEFNEMNTALEEMIQTAGAMERAQLELELRNFQTQLSPHMIFNSITAIRWMATIMGADRVSDMLIELSEMLRPVFRDWKIEWTLEEELAHLDHYARLLDLRYGNHFSMKCDIPESLLEQMLPRFTLQPLVENACEHGGIDASTLTVKIRCWEEDDRICFCVSDNGKGIEPERLAEITRRLESGERVENIGLYSVYNRLRLCKGQESRMQVLCAPEGGTEVRFSWPMRPKPYQN